MSTVKSEARNLYTLIHEQIEKHPDIQALILPDLTHTTSVILQDMLTYQNLGKRVRQYQEVLTSMELGPGSKVILLVQLSGDTISLLLALMAVGAIPVLINSGLSFRKFLHCMATAEADMIVAESTTWRKLRWLPVARKVPIKASLYSTFSSYPCLSTVANQAEGKEQLIFSPPVHHPALITFTSGSSGKPKGVMRSHEILIHQHLALKAHFPPPPNQIDLPGFPVVTLHNLCCGATTVIPHMDFKRVDEVKPQLILQQIQDHHINTLSGSPAYLQRLVDHCLARQIQLDHVYGLVTGGAPISQQLCRELRQVFPQALLRVNYGSSEAEPISAIDADEWANLPEANGKGFCVGTLAESVQIRHVPLEKNIREGELWVSGPHVCQQYFQNPTADAAYKKRDPDGRVWHRTGDIGYQDKEGRWWLVGRSENLIRFQGRLISPFPLERSIQALEGVEKCALIAAGEKGVTACIIGEQRSALFDEILGILENSYLPLYRVRYLKEFPVDARHRAKVEYGKLRA